MYARTFDFPIRRASQQESGLPEPSNVVSDHPPQAPSMNQTEPYSEPNRAGSTEHSVW